MFVGVIVASEDTHIHLWLDGLNGGDKYEIPQRRRMQESGCGGLRENACRGRCGEEKITCKKCNDTGLKVEKSFDIRGRPIFLCMRRVAAFGHSS